MNYRLIVALLTLCGCQSAPPEPTKVDGVSATDRLSSMRPGAGAAPGAPGAAADPRVGLRPGVAPGPGTK